jgi:predicted 3-demethylubiquinone-9 3-methyltransferase (glyoxalase superfamily)
MKKISQKISAFLWFDNQAEEAANFYVSVFNGNPNKKQESKVLTVNRYDENSAKAAGRPEGSVMIASFELEGQEFTALNGGPQFQFSGAISFMVRCETQKEIDYFWDKLGAGGETGVCGWINRDKFNITWQIVPVALEELMESADEEKGKRVMKAMLEMSKLDIEKLRNA